MTTPEQEAIALKIERELRHPLTEAEAWALRCGIQEAEAHGRGLGRWQACPECGSAQELCETCGAVLLKEVTP